MKPHLLHPDRGTDTPLVVPADRDTLEEDLDLTVIYDAMAAGDPFLRNIARAVLTASLVDPADIAYRQHILADALANPELVRTIYTLATDAAEGPRHGSYAGLTFHDPAAILHRSLARLDLLLDRLHDLRALVDTHRDRLTSHGMTGLCTMLADQLDDTYLTGLHTRLAELATTGTVVSAALGAGNKATDYHLHPADGATHRRHLPGTARHTVNFHIPDSDDEGHRALTRLLGHGIDPVATALAESADNMQGFLARLRAEIAFYLGCLNLHHTLTDSGVPTAFPTPTCDSGFTCGDLRDLGLCLTTDTPVIGNTIDAGHKTLIMVTGTNSGGKSTFLRSLATAQILMQAGVFVPANAFTSGISHGIHTHYKREEDPTLRHGKLDEELARLADTIHRTVPGALLLCNESLTTTNEREATRIAGPILDALTAGGVTVVFNTHLYNLAHQRHTQHHPNDLFLRTRTTPDNVPTYQLTPAPPEPTGHAHDTYQRVLSARWTQALEPTP